MRLRTLVLPLLTLLAACSDPASRSSAAPANTLGAPASALAEPNRQVPTDLVTIKMSFAPVVRRAAPAVVNVFSQRVVRQQVDPFFQMFGGGMGVPRERVEGSLGSGVIVRADGLVITNNHVVEGGQDLRVVLADRREFAATVLLSDSRADIAVLKIDAKGERLPTLPIADRDDAQVGDLVLAIGDPFGVGQTVTNGIVSALARTDVGPQGGAAGAYIQTDAAINPGNSGGPLVDMRGNIIGINTFILSRSGSSSGVGFAIPAGLVRRVVDTAVGGAKSVQRPWLGAKTQVIDAETARSLGLDRPGGLLVASVYPGSPGARAGLEQGDVIATIDGQAVNDEAGLGYRLATHRPGETVAVRVRRGKALRETTARLETPPASPAKDERQLAGRQPLQGAVVVNLSPAAADEYGLDPFLSGVIITKLTNGYAAQAGFQPGDIIRQVNGQAVTSTAALATAMRPSVGGWRMVIERGGRRISVSF